MTSCCGAERRRRGRRRRPDGRYRPSRLVVTIVGCALGVCAACSSPDPAAAPLASPSAREAAGSPSRASAPSPSACAQLQADGHQLADVLDQYSAGQTSRVQVLAAAENLLHSAQDTLATTGGALRTQLEEVQSTTRTLVATLRASPPPSAGKVTAAAQSVADALKGLDRPCPSAGASPRPSTTP